jgi:hypothetical protein
LLEWLLNSLPIVEFGFPQIGAVAIGTAVGFAGGVALELPRNQENRNTFFESTEFFSIHNPTLYMH